MWRGGQRPAAETVLARIVRLVQEAQERRPPAQLFIERFERAYAKYVVAGALLLAIVPPLLLGWTFRVALYRAMIFLVVASPCALAAAMMPALLSALSNGARSGVLFKGSSFVEAIGHLDAVAFDKTGTLTTGTPCVTDVVALDGGGADHVLSMAAAVESLSNHPLGGAIVAEARRRRIEVPEATSHEAVGGVGAHASVDGVRCAVGKPGMFSSVHADTLEARRRLEAEGKTVVLVGDDRVRGLVALRDTVRPEARAAIARLRGLGVRHATPSPKPCCGSCRVSPNPLVQAFRRRSLSANLHFAGTPARGLWMSRGCARARGGSACCRPRGSAGSVSLCGGAWSGRWRRGPPPTGMPSTRDRPRTSARIVSSRAPRARRRSPAVSQPRARMWARS